MVDKPERDVWHEEDQKSEKATERKRKKRIRQVPEKLNGKHLNVNFHHNCARGGNSQTNSTSLWLSTVLMV